MQHQIYKSTFILSTNYLLLILLCYILISNVDAANKRTKRGLVAIVGKCPDNYENEFCSCDVNEATLAVTINCNNIKSSDQLKNALNIKWDNDRFDYFVLQNSTLTSHPGHLFNNLSFMGFIMSYNNIEEVADDFFAGSENSCEYIWMSDNKLGSGFNFKSIRNLKKLISFSILSSNLTEIPDNAFGQLPKLETIIVEKNSIETMGANAFRNLPRLRRLDLSWNNLTTLINDSLNTKFARKPVAVNLVHNNISEIEINAFDNLKTYYVNMKYNNLSTLKQEVFEPLLNRMSNIRGSKLFVEGNLFICDKSINWLMKKPLDFKLQIHGLQCINQDNVMSFASHN